MSSRGTLTTGATGRSPPENLRSTRSQTTKHSAQQASTTPQAATLEKKMAKARELELEARKLLLNEECLTEEASLTHHTILTVLTLIIQKYSATVPQNAAKALAALATILRQVNNASNPALQFEKTVDSLSQKLAEHIGRTMHEEMDKMSTMLKVSLAEQSKALTPPENLAETVTSLKQVASDMSKSINEATTVTTQINDTAHSYKQALLRTTTQAMHLSRDSASTYPTAEEEGMFVAPQPARSPEQTDPKILRDMDRKARQILIDTLDPDITGVSQAEIKEKVSIAITKITEPAPPKDTSVIEVIKLRKGGFTILFKDKATVKWLQEPGVEHEFTTELSRDAVIVKCSYSLLVPRIPLSFNPANEEHLREVEECNDIPADTITKARWIKPVNRRVDGQRAAHAIFIFKDIMTTNLCIRDGLKVCGLHIRPSRLKHEPMQCMKCRRWGHFAHACLASADTCRTCGEEHRTSNCDNKEKTYCVSCKSNTHASWDRECPEFRKRCDQFNENYLENNLPYFPSEESWTLTPRPNKLQRHEKFPPKYAVNALQQPGNGNREVSTKSKHQKQRIAKMPPNQSTMDQFITKGNTQATEAGNAPEPNNADTAALIDTNYPIFNFNTPDEGSEPQGWD